MANERALKRAPKEAVIETLHEQRELLHDVFLEALEDFALAGAIREGQKTKRARREEVFRVLDHELLSHPDGRLSNGNRCGGGHGGVRSLPAAPRSLSVLSSVRNGQRRCEKPGKSPV